MDSNAFVKKYQYGDDNIGTCIPVFQYWKEIETGYFRPNRPPKGKRAPTPKESYPDVTAPYTSIYSAGFNLLSDIKLPRFCGSKSYTVGPVKYFTGTQLEFDLA